MKVKNYIKPADKVYGVKAVINCKKATIDKNKIFNFLRARALRCVWADENTIVEYEEEAVDVKDYWTELGCSYEYELHKHVKLIDYVPNFEKWYKHCQEIAMVAKEKDDMSYYAGKTKPRQSTIYDRVVSVSVPNYGVD